MGGGGNSSAATLRRRKGEDSKKKSGAATAMVGTADANPWKQRLEDVKDDLQVLKSIWFHPIKRSGTHAERLDAFYAPQARQYDKFRSAFLWGREPLLRNCAARLKSGDMARPLNEVTWVDLGGGTAENVAMMDKYIPIKSFKKVYVVDLCASLCRVAEKKCADKGWTNVEVVEGDACTFKPAEGKVTLVTFSYSLSMIPPFIAAIDNGIEMLQDDGIFGIADFYVSSKFDLPLRQMSWARRFFWRSIFDQDNIDLGPERRAYIEHKLERISEFNGNGSIPYVPYLRAPYYVWLGRKGETTADMLSESKVERPPMFPPTFLYNMSWEDPRPDEEVLQINDSDVVLTLTSGGDNTLDLAIQGASAVHSVDMNPAQSYLLELKKTSIQKLGYGDVWKLFGEGAHPRAKQLLEEEVGPFMTQGCQEFWYSHTYYFSDSLYYHGAMGKVIWWVGFLMGVMGMRPWVQKVVTAPTIEAQRAAVDSSWFVALLKMIPFMILRIINRIVLNPAVLWWGMGVPYNQWKLISGDGRSMLEYAYATVHGIAYETHIKTKNYFYLACLTGKYTHECCPRFLTEEGFDKLTGGAIENVHVHTTSFLDQLTARTYSKVILMDHCDWMDDKLIRTYAEALAKNVCPGGRVIWRSASLNPPYVDAFDKAGFNVRCVARHTDGNKNPVCIDNVNMYASFWVAERRRGGKPRAPAQAA